jgi:pyruvyltransferase
MYNVWWLQKDKNFGDILTPYLLDYFNIKYNHTDINVAEIICIGSIARHAKDNTIVLGSGMINSRKEKLNPNANWRFVRGPYTRQQVIKSGGECPEIYGDPALLLPLFCEESIKEYDVGFVPHFVDYNVVKDQFPNHKVINVVNNNPLEVAKEITKCRSIISSSLHGIIAAHAYGIPAAWALSINGIKGNNVKFEDHYASVDTGATMSTFKNPIFNVPTNIDTTAITNIFRELASK